MPVYNERATIDEIVRRVMAAGVPLQLIVVDDVSTDGTWERLVTLQRDLGFTLVRQSRQRGKGAAVRRGFEQVTGDLVLIQDADLEYAPEEYPRLIEPIVQGRSDVVYGSRLLGDHKGFLPANYVANRLFTFLTNVLYRASLTDMATCYKMMRTDVLRSLTLQSERFDLDFEITAKVLRTRCRICEVPVSYRGRSYKQGKKITWRDAIAGIWVLLKYRVRE